MAKEKALQLERKRKAAQFLAQLAEKKTTVSSVTTDTPGTPGTPGHESAEEGELGSADTNTHVSVTSDRDILPLYHITFYYLIRRQKLSSASLSGA